MRRIVLACLAAIVVSLPFATWWLVGDLSETTYHPDYMFHPVSLPESQQAAIGWTATAVLVLATTGLVAALWRGADLRRGDVLVVVPLIALGVFLGIGYRIVTAGVSGANIGGGGLVLFGIVFIPTMLFLSAWAYARHRPVG